MFATYKRTVTFYQFPSWILHHIWDTVVRFSHSHYLTQYFHRRTRIEQKQKWKLTTGSVSMLQMNNETSGQWTCKGNVKQIKINFFSYFSSLFCFGVVHCIEYESSVQGPKMRQTALTNFGVQHLQCVLYWSLFMFLFMDQFILLLFVL